jgi:hypothetical protein
VTVDWQSDDSTTGVLASHDGYFRSHGLVHVRSLRLGLDGRGITGEDALDVPSPEAARAFDRALDASRLRGHRLRDPLPPAPRRRRRPRPRRHGGVDGAEERRDLGVPPRRPRGAVAGAQRLPRGRPPRAARHAPDRPVGRAPSTATRVGWTISKAQDTPSNIRDFVSDDLATD